MIGLKTIYSGVFKITEDTPKVEFWDDTSNIVAICTFSRENPTLIVREISKVKTTIWELQNINSPGHNFILFEFCSN